MVNGVLILDQVDVPNNQLKAIQLQDKLYLGSINMESVKVSQVEVSSGLLSTASLVAMTGSPCTLAQGNLLAWQDMAWGEGQTTSNSKKMFERI